MTVLEMTALDRLPAVGLAELTASAALMTRVDRKYLVPADELAGLLWRLPAGTRALEIDGRRRFGYRSEYLDTPALDSYHGAAYRRRRRFKVRLRTYLDSGERFAEVKTRGARGVTVKHRMPYAGDAVRLDAGARLFVDATLCDAGIGRPGDRLRPALNTWYERVTLGTPDGARVTVDTDLAFALPGSIAVARPGPTPGACTLRGVAVVETKSLRGAGEVDRLLWRLGHRPCAMSKYATGLAALRPELPANRWHPILRRHFPTLESS